MHKKGPTFKNATKFTQGSVSVNLWSSFEKTKRNWSKKLNPLLNIFNPRLS